MAFNPAEEAKLAEEVKRLLAIENEADRNAALAKAALATTDKGAAFDYLSKQITALEEQAKHSLAADVGSFNTKVGDIRTEVGVGLDGKGLTGGSATVLTGVMDNTLGAASVGVTGSMKGNGELGDPTISARYVSPPLINDKNSSFEAVAIGAAGVTIPTTNREFTGADVSIGAGGVVFDKPSGLAFTGLVTTDGTGKNPALWGRVSGNVYEDANTRLAANLNGGLETATSTGSVGAGLFAEHKLDKLNTVYASAGVTIGDPGGANNIGAAFNVGATFDVMPATSASSHKSAEPPFNEMSPNATGGEVKVLTPATIAPTPSPTAKDPGYDFLALDEKVQQKVLTLMAENYRNVHPDVSTKDAKSVILEQLAAASYHVDSHGTKSRADDTPQRLDEHVASR